MWTQQLVANIEAHEAMENDEEHLLEIDPLDSKWRYQNVEHVLPDWDIWERDCVSGVCFL